MKIIAGMHRSGTSLVARLFKSVGADLGDPASFYPADQWNVDGYFELPAIHAVNMPLVHGRAGRASYLRLPSADLIERRGERLATIIRSTADAHSELVIKDCRFSLTLDAWLQQGARIEGLVVCLRDPRSVAMSLRRRNHLPLKLGMGLWYEHNSRLLNTISEQNLPSWIINYDELFGTATFQREMAGGFNLFQLPVTTTMLDELAVGVVKPQLRNNQAEPAPYPAKVDKLWHSMLEMRESQFLPPVATDGGDPG